MNSALFTSRLAASQRVMDEEDEEIMSKLPPIADMGEKNTCAVMCDELKEGNRTSE
ncbi:hypothetical protein RYZ26_10685 [Terasakiella sp. A23]|uniref:hypothetical protein n=1 Tax=Terasakiella sp. FCG-A23 TaxID=3080561 RepID=UPI0029555D58|nr:hypothetical protein [Terasakiella sp. A23]MDV7340061.1 hypothetical protein [Terasakiella sp. A23]